MLLTAGFWQECCEISSQAWCPLGPRRSTCPGPVYSSSQSPWPCTFTTPLNTWPDRAPPHKLKVQASLLLFLWCLPGICPALELARVQSRWHLRDLSPLTKDSKLAWKALLPEGSWSNSWSKTKKNNYRAIWENVKANTNTMTLVSLDLNWERLAWPAFRLAAEEWSCGLFANSWSIPNHPKALLHGLALSWCGSL